MKYVKMLGFVAGAAALMASIGTGTASATTLCKNNTTTAKCSETYGPNTVIEGALKVSTTTSIEDTFGKSLGICFSSSLKLEVAKAGGATETVSGPIEELTFGGVGCSIATVEAKTFEIHQIANTDNGTLTAKNFQLSVTVSGETCIYGEAEVDLGTLAGGAPATIKVNAVLPTVNKCKAGPTDVRWTAEYTMSAPAKGTFFVAAG